MQNARKSIEELQDSQIPAPISLDYIEFEFEGINFRIFGILHGITGGLNHEYREFVKKSIRNISGFKIAEKGMKQLYRNCGIDEELEDWLVLRPIDCLLMGIQLILDPRCLWMVIVDTIVEQLRQKDPFVKNRKQNYLGGSPFFHYLDEHKRRKLIGFLPPQEAIVQDIRSMSKWYRTILPKKRHCLINHPQWRRILLLERLMHIPCRSLHMLHYAKAYARVHQIRFVNVFIGETHNTDILYLATSQKKLEKILDKNEREVMQNIIQKATTFGERQSLELILRKIFYVFLILTGTIISIISIYIVILIFA